MAKGLLEVVDLRTNRNNFTYQEIIIIKLMLD